MNRSTSFMIVLVALAGIVGMVMLLRTDPSPKQIDHSTAELSVAAEQVSPEPTFVGRHVCKECHSENFDLHAHSGHANTFFDANDPRIAEKFFDRELETGEPFGSYSYFVDEHGLKARRDGSEDDTFPLHYALGSGEHAITLLSVIDDSTEGTIGIEHRVTWFGTDRELGLTPGHDDHVPAIEPELFGVTQDAETLQDCISCHSTTGKVVDQEIVDHVRNVNCEKCHGPGSEHVKQARQSEIPPPFSVGRADWTTESEIRLCGTCHRLPKDVSRKHLREYEHNLVRFQPIGLVRSECYLQSDFELRCTHCHNPHMAAKAKTKAAYQQDCIDCHLDNSPAHVACPVSPTDGCVKCHMKATTLNHGVTFHDHWIRVYPDE